MFASIFLFLLTIVVESYIPYFDLYGVIMNMLGRASFYIGILITMLAIVCVDVGITYVRSEITLFYKAVEKRVLKLK